MPEAYKEGLTSLNATDPGLIALATALAGVTPHTLADLYTAIGNISLGIPSGSITSAMISPTAGILGSQLSATAGIVGSQMVGGTVTATQAGIGVPRVVSANVTWNGAASQQITVLPSNCLLLTANTYCTTTFNGGTPSPAVTVGYAGYQTNIIPTCGLTSGNVTGDNPSTLGADLYDSTAKRMTHFYPSGATIYAYLTAGGSATQGALTVYLTYVQVV